MLTYSITSQGFVSRSDGAFIPADPLNADYAAYLAWCAAGNTATQPGAETLDEIKQRLSDDIDSQVAAAYASWQRFQAEYEKREEAATAFKSAGYVGDPGIYVTGYATAAGVTNKQAADTILAQATMLNGALASIGAQRMRKYAIQGAADAASAQAVHDDIVSNVNTIIAGIT
jgi:hypothetical protein